MMQVRLERLSTWNLVYAANPAITTFITYALTTSITPLLMHRPAEHGRFGTTAVVRSVTRERPRREYARSRPRARQHSGFPVAMDLMSRVLSPYDLNPFGLNPLRSSSRARHRRACQARWYGARSPRSARWPRPRRARRGAPPAAPDGPSAAPPPPAPCRHRRSHRR